MQHTVVHQNNALNLPATKQVALTAPFKWLAAGFRDYLRTPLSSSFYGLVFVALGYLILAASWQAPILVFTFVTGFFLIAPFLALGLYDLSRQSEQEQKTRFIHSLFAFRQNKMDVALLGVFHALVLIAWIRLATLIGALYFSHSGTNVTVLLEQLWTTGEGIEMLVLFGLTGAALAALVFISSAVSWPMILDRNKGVVVAMVTSFKAVTQNKLAMLIWAVLIGALFIVGVATLYIGLLFIIPILGHATWHSYKDLVE